MANHPSALKRHRQSEKRCERNKVYRTRVKSLCNKVRRCSKKLEASASLSQAVSVIHKAAKKGVFHKSTASRKISRLTRFVNQLSN